VQHYTEHDQQRAVAEPTRAGRTAFQRDHARVVHSAAFRRLAAKTQVLMAGLDDFPRTRLTHSLECAQVGREMAVALGADPDVVEVACLAHDAGHPPFGHNGESALNEIAVPCGGFEGNAQSFRLLTRTEAKRFDADGASVGLNLTRACLDAATKYPWPREQPQPTSQASSGKFGVYDDDLPLFTWMRQQAPDRRRCFEAQVMDWSDDVAYSVHDVEDGLHLGLLRLSHLDQPEFAAEVVQVAAQRFGVDPELVTQALQRLVDLPQWQAAQAFERGCGCPAVAPATQGDGQPPAGPRHACLASSRPAAAAMKNLTSFLIGRFARSAEEATRARFGSQPLLRYHADLVIPPAQRAECDVLKATAAVAMMLGPRAQRRYDQQRHLLHTLAQALVEGRVQPPDPLARADLAAASDETARLRAVVDALAGLTDTSAVGLFHHLTSRS
jgi:dGTPase